MNSAYWTSLNFKDSSCLWRWSVKHKQGHLWNSTKIKCGSSLVLRANVRLYLNVLTSGLHLYTWRPFVFSFRKNPLRYYESDNQAPGKISILYFSYRMTWEIKLIVPLLRIGRVYAFNPKHIRVHVSYVHADQTRTSMIKQGFFLG